MGAAPLAALALCVTPPSVLAAGGGDGCNPWSVATDRQVNDYSHHRFIWQSQSDDANYSGTVFEARGAVEVYSPWVSQGLDGGTADDYGGSSVSGWVMLDQYNVENTYVQGGWVEYYQGHRWNFAEMDVPGKKWVDWYFAPDAVNSTHWWDVKFNQGYLDPTTQPMYVVQHDSEQPVWLQPPDADYQFIPNEATMAVETHATADQVPGGYSNHDWMGYLNVATEKNTGLHLGSTDSFHDSWDSWYGLQTYPDNSMQTWDWACAS